MEELYKNYNHPSATKFKEILKQNNVKATNKEINDFVNNYTINQLHKPVSNYKLNFKFITTNEPYEMLQIDLLDYTKYSTTNKGYKYILIAIDIFTRYAYAEPIKNKTPSSVLQAFMKFNIKKLTSIYHDSGNEFKGVFLKYLTDNNIIDLKAELGDHHSLGVIDRFSKTIKTVIEKYMSLDSTTKYYDELPKIVTAYNKTPHSALNNISPNNAFKGDGYDYVKIINQSKQEYNKSLEKKLTNKIKIGDYVRVKLKKKKFQKGYEITYSNKIYEVKEISGSKVILDDNTKHSINDVILTNKNNIEIDNTEKNKLNKVATVKRKIRKEGIQSEPVTYEPDYWKNPYDG